MNIDSVLFISCFFPAVLLLYWLIPGKKAGNLILLIAGLVFCAFGSIPSLLLLVLVAVVNFLLGRPIRAGKHSKTFCTLAIVINLGFLVFFKYLEFLLSDVLGLQAQGLSIVAPLGISFYIFKSISYIIDIYRDPTLNAGNFWELLLYLSFFPQLTAGPIGRFPQFQQQLTGRQKNTEQIACGIRRFVIGLGKKLILAGSLSAVADGVFALEAGKMDFRLGWVGAIAYMLQIYFDFSGYSDMAIGLGNAFGIAAPENFRYPYAAVSITDFWRRWHISLSTWFKDYLYIPLGGNRKGKGRAALNKALVFLFCGIWHGADWTFLLWGIWHGLLSALESAGILRPKGGFLGRIYTLLAVCLGFVMFRAESVSQGFAVIGAMFSAFSLSQEATQLLRNLLSGEAVFAFIAGAVLALPVLPRINTIQKGEKALNGISWILCLLLFVLCLARLASGGFAPFIYAQF